MPVKLLVRVKGGPGSGNYGHSGRPGLVGGSGGSGGGGILTDEEVSALHSYSWLSSNTINDEIREDNLSNTKPFGRGMSRVEQVDLMDSAIAKARPVAEDITLYSKFDAVHIKRAGDFEVGKTIHNPGYLSTTDIPGGVAAFPGQERRVNAVLVLRVPKGTKGVLPLQSVSHYPQESEHLIGRGSSYKVLSITAPDAHFLDPYTIEAELL